MKKSSESYFRNMNKSAQANIITIILFILIALVVVVIFWNVVNLMLKKSAEQISMDSFILNGNLDYYLPGDFAVVKVSRGSSEGNITGVKLIFEDNDGFNYFYNTTDPAMVPKPLETKKYIISKDQIHLPAGKNFNIIKKISLYFIFADNKLTNELAKEEVNSQKISKQFGEEMWYPDLDGDGYGNNSVPGVKSLGAPATCNGGATICVPDNTDCLDSGLWTLDDSDLIHPGVTETSCGVDMNCDGTKGGDETCTSTPATPYCDKTSKVCGTNKNYDSSSYGISTLWSTSDCTTWNPVALSTAPVPVDLGKEYSFYTGKFNTIYICRNGYVSMINIASCLGPTSAISNINGIAANHKYAAETTADTFSYCQNSDELLLKWVQGTLTSKIIIKSNNEITFTYSGTTSTWGRIGVSSGSSTYSEQKNGYYNGNNLDYRFIGSALPQGPL